MSVVAIRAADVGDAEAITEIYGHHVLNGTASFELEPPAVDFWRSKIGDIVARGWPFVVAAEGYDVLGYAYATQFRDRPAYARTCENSVYVRTGHDGRGIGSMLMSALIDAAQPAGFREMIAVIGGGEPASVALHTKAGFHHAGRMERVGEKFGRLLDTVYMQRSISDTG